MRGNAFVYRFGAFELDPASRRLVSGAERVRLTEPQLSLLLHLVSHAPQIVDKNALARAGWGGTTSDENLQQAISRLRRALSERGGPTFVEAVRNEGYRFVAPIERRESEHPIAALGLDSEPLRAFLQGRRDLATLKLDAIEQARRGFEKMLQHNADYAPAHTSLAHACALVFEASRVDEKCDMDALSQAVDHARVATMLDPASADGWSTLGFVLSLTGDAEAATVAALKAVAIDRATWRHQLRLAFVTWGDERIDAAQSALALRPDLALACWLKATVFVARGAFEPALTDLQAGCAAQDRQKTVPGDYPAIGLHLLRGLVLAAQERLAEAEDEFVAELAGSDRGQLYWRECAANTWYARGAVRARRGQIRDANAAFERALEIAPGHLFSLAALARPLPALAPADPRAANVVVARSVALARAGRHRDAAEIYRGALASGHRAHAGWILPVEPILHVSARTDIWDDILAIVRERAT